MATAPADEQPYRCGGWRVSRPNPARAKKRLHIIGHNTGSNSTLLEKPSRRPLAAAASFHRPPSAAIRRSSKQLIPLALLLSIIVINYIRIFVSTSALPADLTGDLEPFKLPSEVAAVQGQDNHQATTPTNHGRIQEGEAFVADDGDRWRAEGNIDDGLSSAGPGNLNRSLTLLDDRSANESSLANLRRQLIRQLTSLIMNHEPERIAERMEGTRVSGQLVSESEFFDGPTNSSVSMLLEPANTIISENQQQQQQQREQRRTTLTTSRATYTLGPSMLVAAGSGNSDDEDDNLMAIQDAQPQDRLNNNNNNNNEAPDDSASGGGGKNNDNRASTNLEEQYVTCSPDYEDSSMVEPSSNLTIEQQQQLLAGADSSGLLAVNGSASGPTNTQLASGDPGADQQQSLAPRAPSLCVMPGSRMIEVITKVITPILFSIIIVVGLLGNIIVMIVILEDRKTEREYTPTGLLILDLSLADLSFIIFCIPFTAWDYSVGHWVFGSLWCKFNQYLIVVCALSSIYTLVLMSVDRFMAIVFPIECISYRTSQNTLYAIYIKWILILAMATPTIAMHGLIDSPAAPDQFTCRFLADQYNPLHFQIVFFITSYLFPLILIFCLYWKLLNKLWFGSRPHGHKESTKTLESKKKVTWLVAGIVVVFALCWCPIQVMLILMRLKSHKITATYVAIQVFSHTLGYMNSCVNPIVYAFASESFHNSFKRSSVGRFCYSCLCIKNNHHRPSNSTYNNHDHERASQTNFRTINHNNNNNNNTNETMMNNTSLRHYPQQHAHHLPDSSDHSLSPLNNQTLLARNGDALGKDCSLSTSTVLESTPSSGRHETRAIPLEPRDRVALPVTGILDSSSRVHSIERASSSDTDQGQPSSSTGAPPPPMQQAPAKQQLVARMVQSGNQAPCYQQELLKSSS